MTKSIEKRLAHKQIEGLKDIVELSIKAEREILQSFRNNYLSQEKTRTDLSYPISLTKENRKELGGLFRIAAILISCRNDVNQESIQKAISMLDSGEDFPDHELVIQFKRHSIQK